MAVQMHLASCRSSDRANHTGTACQIAVRIFGGNESHVTGGRGDLAADGLFFFGGGPAVEWEKCMASQ